MNKLLQYAGLVSTIVLLCGMLKFYIYYKQFGISILRFIDLSEIFALFMDNLLGYISMLIPTTLNLLIIVSATKNKFLDDNYSAFDSIKNHWVTLVLFAAILIIYASFYFYFGRGIKKFDYILLLIFITACIIGVPWLFLWIMHTNRNGLAIMHDANFIYFCLLCFLLIGFAIAAAFAETRKVKKDGFLSKVKITLKDGSSLDSDHKVYFIGMTKAYFFIYNSVQKECLVYKTEEIKKMVF